MNKKQFALLIVQITAVLTAGFISGNSFYQQYNPIIRKVI